MIVIRAIVLACISLIFTGAAQAQFPGDVFFQNPSIAIQEGGTGQIEVVTFAGTDVLGAAQFDIVFDPSALEVVGVTPGSAEELERTMVSKVSNGKVSVIILNDRSLTKPFGTVSLVRIDVRPLLPAGSRINLVTDVKEILMQDSTTFGSFFGFGGEVVVTSAISTITQTASQSSAGSSVPVAEGELMDRAALLRRPGSVVSLMVLDQENIASEQRVLLQDPSVPTD